MFGRVRKARVKRYAQVRLRIQRRDPEQRPAVGRVVVRRKREDVASRMARGIQRIGHMVRRAARSKLAYWRVRNPVRPRDSK
jgi:hypothetical protein